MKYSEVLEEALNGMPIGSPHSNYSYTLQPNGLFSNEMEKDIYFSWEEMLRDDWEVLETKGFNPLEMAG